MYLSVVKGYSQSQDDLAGRTSSLHRQLMTASTLHANVATLQSQYSTHGIVVLGKYKLIQNGFKHTTSYSITHVGSVLARARVQQCLKVEVV